MSSFSGALVNDALSVDSVKRKLDFDEPSSREMEVELLRASTRKTKRSRRLDFGETDPSVLLRFPDLQDQMAFISESVRPYPERSIFSDHQKAKLEAMFRKKKYPSFKEKATLAAALDINIKKLQNWFSNRRQKWKKEQKKGAVGPSGCRPTLPRGRSLIKRSCKRTFKSTVSFECFPQFPAQEQVQSQPQPPARYQATAPITAASHQVTQSFAACVQTYSQGSHSQQLYPQQYHPQQHLSVRRAPVVAETVSHLQYQQLYPPFPHLMQRVPPHQPDASHLALQATASSIYSKHQSAPPYTPWQPEVYQTSAADAAHFTDGFPFSYSIAKELPHIFGNVEEDEVLDRPLTPSFEPLSDLDPLWDPLALESYQPGTAPAHFNNEDFIDCVLPEQRDIQRNRLHSCCFGGNGPLRQPPTGELFYGFMSEGRSFRFCRQD